VQNEANFPHYFIQWLARSYLTQAGMREGAFFRRHQQSARACWLDTNPGRE
jgi:hypothetical protein